MNDDISILRAYVRHALTEISWEDPSVVYAKEDEDDDSPDAKDAASGTSYKHNKAVEKNLKLHQRDTNANSNRSMASMKPIAPSNGGGAKSGRQPGNRSFSPGRTSYNAGF